MAQKLIKISKKEIDKAIREINDYIERYKNEK